MYESFFGLKELPFTLTPNTDFYYGLPPHQEAMVVLKVALESGEGFSLKLQERWEPEKPCCCGKL